MKIQLIIIFALLIVNLNFFVEKHGKSSRDVHFSCISGFIKRESLLYRLKNSQDVVSAITNGQKKANENRKTKSKFSLYVLT